ncbi:MAG TPA: Hsp20/alpha crystallin family protein [Acidiferrobacteraceae bacterium]|nr:Hsp20/alpha crystallin family protein [Acidiferrobacteraceae bacterium]
MNTNHQMQTTGGREGWSLVNDELDNLFEGFFRPLRRANEAAMMSSMPMDVAERENEYVIRAEMPGISKERIDVTLTNGVVTITGESREELQEKDGERVLRQERRYGKCARSVRLGTRIDEKNIKATYRDGVLELVLPKAEEVKPKKIALS